MTGTNIDFPIEDDIVSEAETFWKEFLESKNILSPLSIPSSGIKQKSHDADSLEKCLQMPEALTSNLYALANHHHLEANILIQGAFALLLHRYGAEENVIFGVRSISSQPDFQSWIHSLPRSIHVPSDVQLLPWLHQLQGQWTELKNHRNTPLAQIKKWVEIPSSSPLFACQLIFLDGMQERVPDGDGIEECCALTVIVSLKNKIELRVRYDSQSFDDATIARLLGHLQTLLEEMVSTPGQHLKDLTLLTESERHQLLVEWNNTQADYPKDKTIHQLFEEQVARTPNAIAVIAEDQPLTYRQLNQRANQLAHYLRLLGAQPNIPIGICIERSLEMVIGLLGILKAGAGYLPLDPTYPQDRLALMMEDAQVSVLLTSKNLLSSLPVHQAQVVCLDIDWSIISQKPDLNLNDLATSHDLAYLIYTSGSTGKPKGVVMNHRPLVNLLQWQADASISKTESRTLQFSPISFDVSFQEIFSTWNTGGTLIVISEELRRDPGALLHFLQKQSIERLFLPFVALQQLADVAGYEGIAPHSLREVITAGEQLQITPQIVNWFTQMSNCTLHNHYGPSESHVITALVLEGAPQTWVALPPIGKVIANAQLYILDADLNLVPIGVPGELYIAVSDKNRGYLNRPELTAEKFIPNKFDRTSASRLYKTGDLVRYLQDGNIEFLGRIDHQIKIRGFRIELGEVEAVVSQYPDVQEAVVVAREDVPGDKRLVAYIVLRQTQDDATRELRQFLQQRLPEYMVPASIVLLEALPLTPSGKVDRKALLAPVAVRPDLDVSYIEPQTPLEQQIAEIWSQILCLDCVGIRDNFFELGGTSILGVQMMTRLQKKLGRSLRMVLLYQNPSISELAQALLTDANQASFYQSVQARAKQQRTTHQQEDSVLTNGIAIIGMEGRFPGAENVDTLWRNLCDGIESNTVFSDADLDESIDPELRSDPNYVRARGIIQDAETFDAAFFGISPREAELMDPQARIFLELAYHALEQGGYTPDSFEGLIGLYAGCGQNTYFERHICDRPDVINRLGAFQTMLANEKDFLTTRTSYKLNLKGPSLSINTACSTSLVAVIQAFHSLMSYQCDMALAGGVSITTPQNSGYLYQEEGILSPDGHCRPFDAKAQGTLFNNGAGLVVLKRLEDALSEGDRIYAVIRGVGINNDGAQKVSFTAPSVAGQAEAILMAQAHANFQPDSISYIEAHGTATALGDPIEIEALTQAFRANTKVKQFCAIGSLKSNMGHLVAAAGVAGLIKTALALHHKQIPPTLNFDSPNPEIDFANSPFYVNNQLLDWPNGLTPRRAGVSSFGVGGTNAHIVLEEAPDLLPSTSSRPQHLLLLSAKTEKALEQMTTNLQTHLQQNPNIDLADVAYTLQRGRKIFHHRRFLVSSNSKEALQDLATLDPNRSATRYTDAQNPEVVFMFPGQGSQYVSMGKTLYGREPIFKAAIDRCAEILQPLLNLDIREVMYPADGDSDSAANVLRQTQLTQPALFAIEYALAQLWQSWGVKPSAMIGHSIGEFVAACLAGVFSLEDGLKLVATRGAMMASVPPGSMLSVRLSANLVEQRLGKDMAIAAVNGPSLCVVSGPTESIAALQVSLEAEEVICKPLHTSHAFHSPMMDSVIAPFAELVKTIQLSPPQIPFVSTVSATWITDAEATDVIYWAKHLRATVRFAEGVQTLWQNPTRVLLEIGPRTTAATLARQQAKDIKRQIAISSLGSTAENNAEWIAILQAMGRLWVSGVTIDWTSFYAEEIRHRLPLPRYPFERQRFWIDPKPARSQTANLEQIYIPAPSAAQPSPTIQLFQNSLVPEVKVRDMPTSRKQQLVPLLLEVLETTSGLDIASADETTTFLEMGLDSLSLTQVALALKKKFKVKVTFRNLLEDYPNLSTLAGFIEQALPPDALPAPVVPAPTTAEKIVEMAQPEIQPVQVTTAQHNGANGAGLNQVPILPLATTEGSGAIATIVEQQLRIMSQQLGLLTQNQGMLPTFAPPLSTQPQNQAVPLTTSPSPATPPTPTLSSSGKTQPVATTDNAPKPKAFGPGAKIEKSVSSKLNSEQERYLDQIIGRYTARTPESKRQAQVHRAYLADPRTVSGFTPLFKEMIYPIVVNRSSGSKLWDVDGNEYVDITNGFGSNFFGWSSKFINDAIKDQLEQGIEIGPQTPLAGRVAKLISELTGHERVAFCNTGSEAVMAAMRLARTVTGRSTIALFAGAYHGTIDEVVIRSAANGRSLPAAPGILPAMVENALVLDYDDPNSLEILRNQIDDLAAIMVEPVQSRRPDLQPIDFLRELRLLTERSGTAFIIDEVVTGFRVHPGGIQQRFGIQADLSSYGKVFGGGLPIGAVAGKAEFMDALDGGGWQFGDDSFPEIGVTFFAGTFVRHPMALAAAEAVLTRLKEAGPELQYSLAAKVEKFVTHLNQHFSQVGAPIKIAHFSSFFYIKYPQDTPYGSLLYYLLREKGIHIWEYRPCFFSLAHTDEDIERVILAFKESVAEMQMAGFLPSSTPVHASTKSSSNGSSGLERNSPPQSGARLGKDPEGNPAWYVPDPDRPGKYLQVGNTL
jgi:amino acid adenylation domain-containing protein